MTVPPKPQGYGRTPRTCPIRDEGPRALAAEYRTELLVP